MTLRGTARGPGLRSPKVTTRIGVALGVSFAICFLTGLLSHWIQHPPTWFAWISQPVWLYRVTQGVHVISGVVAIPLLLAKLAVVFPKLFEKPLLGSPARMLERLSIGVLVASAIFQLISGLMNTAQWYPWKFFFTTTHYAMAYVVIGALAVHIAVKLPIIREALDGPLEDAQQQGRGDEAPDDTVRPADIGRPPGDPGISRRGLLRLTWGAAGIAAVAFAGQTVPFLRPVAFLAPRSGTGPQGVPINRTAQAAGVVRAASDTGYRLELVGPDRSMTLSINDIRGLPQRRVDLPIACVEGWSADAQWEGVRLRDLIELVGGDGANGVRVISIERGPYAVSEVPTAQSQDDTTLMALRLNGNELNLDHGYPCRLIAPNLPGVMQTKWVQRIEVH